MKRLVLGIAVVLISPLSVGNEGVPATGCTITHYRVIELPLLPAAINDAGEVVGTTPSHRAAIWTAQQGLRELPMPAGFEHSEAFANNDRGHVVGMVYDRSFQKHQPFLFANDSMTLLPGDHAKAKRISNTDEVAGEAVLAGKQRSEPVVWTHDGMRPLDSCCGGSVERIDEDGDAIGDAYDEQGRYYASMWNPSRGMYRIGPPEGYSNAIAANNRGHVIVEASAKAFLYADATLTRLDLAPKLPSHPHAINDCDIVVGYFGLFSDAGRAFAWERTTGFQDLNTRIPPGSGWKLESAIDINNRGDIVGKGDPPGKEETGFLLIPE